MILLEPRLVLYKHLYHDGLSVSDDELFEQSIGALYAYQCRVRNGPTTVPSSRYWLINRCRTVVAGRRLQWLCAIIVRHRLVERRLMHAEQHGYWLNSIILEP